MCSALSASAASSPTMKATPTPMHSMKRIVCLFCLCHAPCWLFAAEKVAERPGFSEYVNPDGTGMRIIEDQGQDDQTTLDMTATMYDAVRLAEILLNESVWEKMKGLSDADRHILLKSHLDWLEHFRTTPSRPTIWESGSIRGVASLGVDLSRIKARQEAMKLDWAQFLVYNTMANSCKIRLNTGEWPMQCGEIRLEFPFCEEEAAMLREDKYYRFPMQLVPQSCVEFAVAQRRCYAAVIRWTTELEGGDETYSYYLGIWDRASDAGEMYLLGRAEQNASITSVSSAKTTDDKLRVFVNVGGAPYQQDFSLADLAKRLEERSQRISDKPLAPPAPRQQAPKP